MRVIGGTHKGRRFSPSKKFTGRPTTDYARESLFNVLMHGYNLEDIDVLDLFAGSGSLTYEFMSRGARTVLAIEKDRTSVKFINKTLQEFDLSGAEVIIGDVFTLLNRDIGTFDIIFADPPFDEPRMKDLPARLLKKSWLNANGMLIVEHPEKIDFSAVEGFDQQRKYGHVCFSFFSHKEA